MYMHLVYLVTSIGCSLHIVHDLISPIGHVNTTSFLGLALSNFKHTLMRPAHCVFLGSSLIAWKTKKQTTISHSSTEAELRAMATVADEVTWLRWLLEDFGVTISTPTLYSDNTGVINIDRDPVKNELTKHIRVDASYMRSQMHDAVVPLRYVPSEFQLADFFTKAQIRAQHDYFLPKVSVVDPP